MLAVLRLRVERGTRRRSTARPHRYASTSPPAPLLVGGRRKDAVSEFSSRNAIMVGGQRVTCGAVICGSGGVPIQLQFGSYSAGILRGFGRVLVNRRRHGRLEKDVRSSPTFKRPARTLRISPGSASRRDASRRDLIDPAMTSAKR